MGDVRYARSEDYAMRRRNPREIPRNNYAAYLDCLPSVGS